MSSSPALKKSLGLIGLTTLGVVMMSPALGIYGCWSPMAELVGKTGPLVFLAALAISLPTAISYALVSREIPSAGSAFTWIWKTLSPTWGTFIGLIMVGFYVVAIILQPILFGLFFNDLLSYCGVNEPGLATWVIGVVVVTVPVMIVTYKGIDLSVRSAVIAVLCEVAVIVALAITILITKGSEGGLNLSPFNPSEVHGGISVFWSAMILGILSFVGYDVISTVAEDTHAPRRLLPRATLLATVGVGLFWVFGSWALSLGEPVSQLQHLNATGGSTAVTAIANDYWSWGRIFVIITGMTAAAAVYIACVIGASRAVYAMGRQNILSSRFAQIEPKTKLPWNANHLVYAISLIGAIAVPLIFGDPLEAYVWWAGVIVFFALIVYLAVNLSNILYFTRHARDRFNPWLNGLVPVVGIALDAYLIYNSFFKSLWPGTFRNGKSVVLLGMAVVAAALIYALWLRAKRPERLGTEAQIAEADIELEARPIASPVPIPEAGS